MRETTFIGDISIVFHSFMSYFMSSHVISQREQLLTGNAFVAISKIWINGYPDSGFNDDDKTS